MEIPRVGGYKDSSSGAFALLFGFVYPVCRPGVLVVCPVTAPRGQFYTRTHGSEGSIVINERAHTHRLRWEALCTNIRRYLGSVLNAIWRGEWCVFMTSDGVCVFAIMYNFTLSLTLRFILPYCYKSLCISFFWRTQTKTFWRTLEPKQLCNHVQF